MSAHAATIATRRSASAGSVGRVEIRPLVSGDLARVHAINQGEVPAVGAESVERLAHIFDQSLVAFAAVEDGTVGGFCLVLPPDADYDSANFAWFRERYDDFVYLDRVAFAPEFQRRGGGRAMYDRVIAAARRERPSATVLALEVNLIPRNEPSLAFHAGLGFVEVGVRTPAPDKSVSMLVKSLDGELTQAGDTGSV